MGTASFLVTCLSYTADLLMWKFFVYFVSVNSISTKFEGRMTTRSSVTVHLCMRPDDLDLLHYIALAYITDLYSGLSG